MPFVYNTRQMANLKKEVKEIVKAAKSQGWRVEDRTKGYALYDPNGEHMEILHKTPSAPAGLKKSISRMRRHGFEWKGH